MFPRAAARALCLMPFVISLIQFQPVQAATPLPATSTHASAQPIHAQRTAFNTFGLTHEVFGYAYLTSLADPNVGYPSWNFNLLSTVAVFSIHVNFNGVLVADSNWNVWDSSTLSNLVSIAHQHGVKVVPTLVPLYGSGDQVDFCDTLYNADTTVLQIVNQVKLKGVDGVNLDYEGQNFACTNNNPSLNNTSQNLYVQLVQKMRAGLDAYRPGLYLSIASYSGSASANDGFFNIPALNPYVDAFFVMAYDMDEANQGAPPLQNCPQFCMAPISPLTNYYWNDTNSMAQYSALVGSGKVILGQPYYGRVACVSTPGANAMATTSLVTPTYIDAAAVINSPDVRPGSYSINRDAADATGVDRWDAWYDTVLGCWREMYWQDVTTLSNRYDMVNQQNLRGIGIWTLQYGGGSSELWSAIQSHFVSCTNTTLTANPATPQLSGTQIQLTAASTACVNPRYQFWVLDPGGTWRVVQPYSSSSTFIWKTNGSLPGTYAFSVWARDANSPGVAGSGQYTYDSYFTTQFTLTTSPCTAVAASFAPPSPASAGTGVSVTASATGCPNPSFEFWMLPPSGHWTLVQSYSSSPTYNWNTSAASVGTYLFSVWAVDASSTATYDAFDSSHSYALTTGPCTSATVSYSPPSPASSGSQITVSASSTGCPSPQYEFWFLPPGGSWRLVQGYSSSSTFVWKSGGWPAGTYLFSAWARNVASSASYDAFDSSHAYTLTVTPCASANVSVSPTSPSKAGTQVVLTATAAGCANPRFEFWYLPPGGSWTLVQGYSPSATFTWITTGNAAGQYVFSVWAQDVSSPGAHGSAPNTYDAYSTLQYALN